MLSYTLLYYKLNKPDIKIIPISEEELLKKVEI